MPSKNPRVNITFEPLVIATMTAIAEQEAKSVACVARELILEALERREDQALSEIASRRDKKGKKRVIHDDAWE